MNIFSFCSFINDTEENIKALINYCVEAKVKGVIVFGIGVTLRDGSREHFYKNLDKSFPGMKERYIKKYGHSYNLTSDNHYKLMEIIKNICIENNIMYDIKEVFHYLKEFEEKNEEQQMSFI